MSSTEWTAENKRWYSRGYGAGRNGNYWPGHRPPKPPDLLTGELVAVLQSLRDAIDTALGCFEEDDALNLELDPHIAAADEVLTKLTEWLKTDKEYPCKPS